jgi:hypothetical protein
MAKWDGLLKKKSAYIIIGIAIICLILSPILGTLLNKVIVYEGKPKIIKEYSTAGITQAFAQKVTLEKDQKLTIQISEFYPNCTINVKIVALSIYESAYRINSTPGSLTGLYFVYSVLDGVLLLREALLMITYVLYLPTVFIFTLNSWELEVEMH